ncbi:MAG: metallophosphatase family protein [Candidatus Thermoplasmatota archaeon]|jgi:protein phosphatase|nr:metallophosphatase family protein [Candidatus Thermoplasmatota archaeon]MCL6002918.1 metallophosphatase family protein [Candidatus Thermoplasmatota archaeon]
MRVLIFSDIHANPYALRALLDQEKFDEAVFLGDVVDYGSKPVETLDMVKEISKYVVTGNHDYAAAFNKDCLCSQENHELSVYTRENITMKDLGKNEINFLRSLPTSLDIELEGTLFKSVHGSPADSLYGYLYPWKVTNEQLKDPMSFTQETGNFLVGHTHYQFLVNYGGNLIVNPGSSGQPRDGNPNPAYAVYDTRSKAFEMKRFSYDRSKLKSDLKERVGDHRQLEKLYKLFIL